MGLFEKNMGLFDIFCSKLQRSDAFVAFKEPSEIGSIGKGKEVSNFVHGVVSVQYVTFGF